jgi:hypothetical protein
MELLLGLILAASAAAAPVELAAPTAAPLVPAALALPPVAIGAAALSGGPALSAAPLSTPAAARPPALAAPAAAAAAFPVKAIGFDGDDYSVNGRPAPSVGSGDFKEVVAHPEDPELVVKVFYSKWASSVPEMRREAADVALLSALGAAPALIESGSVSLRGRPTGFLVQERVRGSTLETPTAAKLRETRALFARLADAGLEMTDTASAFKLRTNVMVGSTRSGGTRAWLVDPEVRRSRLSPARLRAFYEVLLDRIVRER